MFDKYGFYYTEKVSKTKYSVDVGLSYFLNLDNNKYVVFHKRNFEKIETAKLQKNMAFLTQREEIDFKFDETFFVYGLTYYQRNLKQAHFKGGDIEQLEIYGLLFEKFGLKLKLRNYLEIHGDYLTIEELSDRLKFADLNQAISFVLALATIHGDWNIVETDDVYLSNVLIRFPFDSSLASFQDMILSLEDILAKNKIYNYLTYTKKGDFIWNIKDVDLLKIMGEFLTHEKVKDFFQIDEVVKPIFETKLPKLIGQLDNDLRISLDSFKLTEIEGISLDF